MRFNTDDQTIADLVVFGKPGQNSLYSIFNKTYTSGGAVLLADMLRYPLADASAINKRSALIKYFASTVQTFPFAAELFDQAGQYLDVTDERTRLSTEKPSLTRSIESFIAEDKDFKLIYGGVTALIAIIRQLDSFIKEIRNSTAHPFLTETNRPWQILDSAAFKNILAADTKGKIPYVKLADYDEILRFRESGNVKMLLSFIYELDVYMTAARVANECGFVFPSALGRESNALAINSFFHPFLRKPVANSLMLGESNVVFLTGANMAGKSTFMKALGICIYLAHTGFPVPAKQMEFSVMDGIFTSINLPDNLSIGASHFYSEVLRVKKVAKELHAGRRLFVVFDELFRGTNVKDAYEATIAITAGFARKADSFFVISTHIIEAGDVLKKECANISFKYLPTRMNGNIPEYTYTLEDGITADRHGMLIINNEGILDILKNQSNKKTMEFEIDKQTLEDLNLLGKYKQSSIFSIFNKVVTEGGEKLLLEMFQQPLTDHELINQRALTFGWFQEGQLKFPFTREQFGAVHGFLDGATGSSFTSILLGGLKSKILQLAVRDQQLENLQKGLAATISNLKLAKYFLRQLSVNSAQNPCRGKVEELLKLVDHAKLNELDKVDGEKLSFTQIIRYDHLLRVLFRPQLKQLLDFLHGIDVFIAVGNIAAEQGYWYATAFPKEDNLLAINDFYHPGIKKAVSNSVSFNGQSNMMFLTGANMAGKSTIMKALGINIYLAHMGFPVAAKSMSFSIRDGLYTSINVFDDLSHGYSHFYAEVLRVKTVALEVSKLKYLLVIFDELFKGTNVKDAYEATLSITGAFSEYTRSAYVISTHIIEAGEQLAIQYPAIRFRYMPTLLQGSTTVYPYRMEEGISADRHGMMIIENEKIPELLK